MSGSPDDGEDFTYYDKDPETLCEERAVVRNEGPMWGAVLVILGGLTLAVAPPEIAPFGWLGVGAGGLFLVLSIIDDYSGRRARDYIGQNTFKKLP